MVFNSRWVVQVLCIVVVIPFAGAAISRMVDGNVLLAAYNGAVALIFAGLAVYVHVTHNVTHVRYFSAFAIFATSIVGLLISPVTGVYWYYVAALGLYYAFPSYIHAAFVNAALYALVLFIVFVVAEAPLPLISFATAGLAINALALMFAYNNAKFQQQLQTLSITDSLTGLGNRRAFMDKVGNVVNLYQRIHLPACLLYLDVDAFKKVNDVYGHAEGDRVLVDISQCLTQTLRKTDNVFRLGGDEFVILVEGTNQEQAKILAEKIRVEIAKLNHVCGAQVSISIGGAEVVKSDTGKSWTNRADEALYQAKKGGKNQSVFISANVLGGLSAGG